MKNKTVKVEIHKSRSGSTYFVARIENAVFVVIDDDARSAYVGYQITEREVQYIVDNPNIHVVIKSV